jgi:hypothetical protein
MLMYQFIFDPGSQNQCVKAMTVFVAVEQNHRTTLEAFVDHTHGISRHHVLSKWRLFTNRNEMTSGEGVLYTNSRDLRHMTVISREPEETRSQPQDLGISKIPGWHISYINIR